MRNFFRHKMLRRPLIICFAVAGVLSILLAFTYSYMKAQQGLYLQAYAALEKSKNKLVWAETNTKILKRYEDSYQRLMTDNIIGTENRLSWIETLNHSKETMGIPNIKYTITERRQDKATDLILGKIDLDLYRTDMTIELELSHEGEMLDILENLRQESKGLFTFEKCETIRNSSRAINMRQGKGMLRSSCTINWYTIAGLD